jgi:hypothetical protein
MGPKNTRREVFMKNISRLMVTMVLIVSCFLYVQTAAAKTLYDDFSGDFINSSNWNDQEVVRQVTQGVLVSKVKNSPSAQDARNQTPIANASSIDIIACDISVNVADPDTGGNSEVFARVDGRFYNAQNSGTERGDIWVGLYLGNRGSGLEAWWRVIEALDDNGNEWEEKGSGTLNVPGGLTYNQSYTVEINYNGTNGFIFSVAGVTASFTGPARLSSEYTSYKALETVVYATGGDGSGYISASFDNVFINDEASAYDDFSTAPLDQSKWEVTEFVREIDNGRVRLSSHSAGDRQNARLNFAEIWPYIEATVRIDSSSTIDPGDRGIARLDGYFYNDTYGPGSYNGYEGNVWAAIYLNYYGDGTLSAACYGEKSLDAGNTQFEELFYRKFNLPIELDRDYKLSIQLADNILFFICKDTVTGRMDIYGYEISTSINQPFNESISLLSRVYGDNSGGYMTAEFDDVYIDVSEPAATFDATGDWELVSSDLWSTTGCELPDVDETTDITITQDGNEIELIASDDEGDITFDGYVYGDTYIFSRTEDEGGETERTYGIINLSGATSGSGSISFIATDGIDTCEGGFAAELTKTSTGDSGDGGGGDGGGGGCFISTLK